MNKYLVIISILFVSCIKIPDKQIQQKSLENQNTSLVILGNVQDAGSPQIGCKKSVAKNFFKALTKIEKWFHWD